MTIKIETAFIYNTLLWRLYAHLPLLPPRPIPVWYFSSHSYMYTVRIRCDYSQLLCDTLRNQIRREYWLLGWTATRKRANYEFLKKLYSASISVNFYYHFTRRPVQMDSSVENGRIAC